MKLYKDRYYLILSILATIISFIFFNSTKAPTVSFWDCGEFIATSYILGIPHPPGNPMFLLIGRFFALLPIAGEIAVRINLISVISSALSVFMAFWLILRISIGTKEILPLGKSRIGVGIGSFAGALIMGLSNTFWSNAVEAEVFGLAMLLMLIISYIAILWAQGYGNKGNDRYIIFIAYLIWFALGVHMTILILAAPVVLYMAYIDYKKGGLSHWPIWAIMLLFNLYAIPIQTQILGIFGINISRVELETFFVIMLAALLISIGMSVFTKSKAWIMSILIIVAAAIGYSTQLYIPIRASENPRINENAPSTWPRFKGFLERKQYGQESMITRMFKRRASWENQFISHPRFGLARALNIQYASPDERFDIYKSKDSKGQETSFGFSLSIIYILLFGFLGAFEAIKRSPPEGVFILFTVLLCTVGLVFYLNFSDGTYNPQIAWQAEVRNRDYFYTPGFLYLAVVIGIGMAAALDYLGKKFDNPSSKKYGRITDKGLFAVASVLVIALAGNTAFANYKINDRTGNYLPFDYAKNILRSCDQDGIIFTNGDNDTFPLWFIQEVEKYRTDVRVVNLSLLNTPWYILQLKHQMNVPITMDDKAIEQLRAVKYSDQPSVWRIQDQMVRHIVGNVQSGGWKIPIYFAITVPSENCLGLDDHFITEGMASRIVESTGKNRINPTKGYEIFSDINNFRGLADPSVTKDENDDRMISNYVASMYQVSNEYFRMNHPDSAEKITENMIAIQGPEKSWQARTYMAMLYARSGRYESIKSLINQADSSEREKIYLTASQELIRNKQFKEVVPLLRQILGQFPSSFTALNNLIVISYQENDTSGLDAAVSKFREDNRE